MGTFITTYAHPKDRPLKFMLVGKCLDLSPTSQLEKPGEQGAISIIEHKSSSRIQQTSLDREEMKRDGIHGLLEAGIFGSVEDGAYAVVLANGYKDDKDSGNRL